MSNFGKKTFDISEIDHVAQALLQYFPEQRTFIFYGEMGAGKTTLIQALCRQLGIEAGGSPTYSIAHEYSNDATGTEVLHFDLFRINRVEELDELGFDDYWQHHPAAYFFIEWPQIAESYLEKPYLAIQIEKKGKTTRTLVAQLLY